MKVRNMESNSGRAAANQFIISENIQGGQKETFQSYTSTIAIRVSTVKGEQVTLDDYYWDYSATTGRYRNQFLGEGIAETRRKIISGEYKLDNLN